MQSWRRGIAASSRFFNREVNRDDARRTALAIVVAAAVAAIWIGLTLNSGLTYHLAPGLIAAAPAFVWSISGATQVKAWRLAMFIGWPTVVVAWLILEALDEAPTATFFAGQPGGVEGEFVIIALIGAALAARFARPDRPN